MEQDPLEEARWWLRRRAFCGTRQRPCFPQTNCDLPQFQLEFATYLLGGI